MITNPSVPFSFCIRKAECLASSSQVSSQFIRPDSNESLEILRIPVLRQDSLRFLTSLAVQKRRALRQGDCKNAFCQGVLPPEEITIVRPPSGDPDANPTEYWLLLKTLYGLRRSPRHWYDKINAILISIGLTPSLEDPCLYSGFIQDPTDPSSMKSTSPLTLGLYVDDFVYFSEDPSVEALFCHLLAERCKVDFMGVVDFADVDFFFDI